MCKITVFQEIFLPACLLNLEKFPTYTIIRNCTFIRLGGIFPPASLFGHYDYSPQQSNHYWYTFKNKDGKNPLVSILIFSILVLLIQKYYVPEVSRGKEAVLNSYLRAILVQVDNSTQVSLQRKNNWWQFKTTWKISNSYVKYVFPSRS